MDEAPIPTPDMFFKTNKDESESLIIEQDNKKYILNIEIKVDSIYFKVIEEGTLSLIYFTRKMNLKEIKDIHKEFYGLNSLNEFLDYLKVLYENKELTINKTKDNMSINFKVIYLLKTSIVEIPLYLEKENTKNIIKVICKELLLLKEKIKNFESNTIKKDEKKNKEENNNEELKNSNEINEENKKLIKEIKNIREEINEIKNMKEEIKLIKDLKEENNIIKEENKKLKDEMNKIKIILEPINIRMRNMYNRSFLFDINDFEFIKSGIEDKTGKNVKGLKKLYQATIDGGQTSIFHSNCDNIPNTLTIIRSAGYRRFGGFTTEKWDTSGKYKDDKKSFLFSLDKKKIYPYKNNGKAIYCHKDYGPTFGAGFTIKIGGNALKEKKLYTYEYYPDGCSYNFNGDQDALSESGKGKFSYIYASEYEVYEASFF